MPPTQPRASLPSSCVGISISGFFRSKSNNGKLINARQTYSVAGRRNAAITLLPFPRPDQPCDQPSLRSEEHTSELQSLMRISYAVFCLKKKKNKNKHNEKSIQQRTVYQVHQLKTV